MASQPHIIAVGGGKGGIGKSLLSANLAVLLGQEGRRVVLFDADLGGANAHTCLGIAPPEAGVADFLRGKYASLEEVLAKTPYPNLRLISGAHDWMQAANPRPQEKSRLGEALLKIDADIVLIDLGAGTGLHTIDFFLLADRGIVALIPEPTSIENAYRFMKMACIRRLQAIEMSTLQEPVVSRALTLDTRVGLKSPAELLREVRAIDPALAARLKRELERYPFALVVNQIRTSEEAKLTERIPLACRRYFGVAIDRAFGVPYSDAAWQAVRARKPLVKEDPDGDSARAIATMAQALVRGIAQGYAEPVYARHPTTSLTHGQSHA